MQDYQLSNPGDSQLLQTLRRIVAKAIADASQDTNVSTALAAFLADAASKCPGYVGPAPGEGTLSIGSTIQVGGGLPSDTSTPATIQLVDGEPRAVFDYSYVGWLNTFDEIPVYSIPTIFDPVERLYGTIQTSVSGGRVVRAEGDLTIPPEE